MINKIEGITRDLLKLLSLGNLIIKIRLYE
jgi:hypothetical protein